MLFPKTPPQAQSATLKTNLFATKMYIQAKSDSLQILSAEKFYIRISTHFCGFVILEEIGQFNILFTVNFLHLPMLFTLRF